MTLVNEIKKTVTSVTPVTPVYAVVGATDLAVEKVRVAGTRAAAVRVDLDVTALQGKAVKQLEKVADQVQQIPTQVRTQSVDVAGKAKETYSELADRGEKLVKRIRNQKATKDLFAQADSTIALGKGAVTTVRNAALDTGRAAKVTLATGRREAEAVASSVQGDVRDAGRSVSNAAAKTYSSARGTATTAEKGAESAKTATKGVATSAKKTATAASKATKTATPKVGD